ncbi:MBL fold metallo-hydrolase [Cellulomonas sp. PhB143]|uniref:MBL fold metallo-hydrolase n=1 Tax=Cellulomonas sp. PhB143 TaxID=2485186 RepID=UPI000F46CF2A|nr:MBL fold metallo-hydrolase [Cellulomonas sp. PhB143]ROS77161.1 glyoxylase-like metal-dependent hydrolase (beta-lactamase superfamily II) [Cellulomonas sp. PhB143]
MSSLPRHGASRGRTLAEVAPGVHVARAEIWSSLTTVVVSDDGTCLVVDPGITVEEVSALADEVSHRGWTVTAGFATHPHWDHVLWHAGFGDAPRWATPTACLDLETRRAEAFAKAEAAAPGHEARTFGVLAPLAPGERVPGGARAVVVEQAAHAPGHAALVLAVARTMLAGDMLSDREVPLLDLASPDPWGDYVRGLDTLEEAAGRHDVTCLVPGHGTPARGAAAVRARFAADRRYLDALARAAEVPAGTREARDLEPTDPRLADPWVAGEHEAQLARLRGS